MSYTTQGFGIPAAAAKLGYVSDVTALHDLAGWVHQGEAILKILKRAALPVQKTLPFAPVRPAIAAATVPMEGDDLYD